MKSTFEGWLALGLVLFYSSALVEQPAPTELIEVHFDRVSDATAYFIADHNKPLSFSDLPKDLKDKLNTFHPNDWLILEVVKEKDKSTLKSVSVKTVQVSRWRRGWILSFSLIGYWLLLWSLGGFFKKKNVLLGQDGRYSNSKFQIAVWFGVLIVSYIDTTLLRWWYCENCFLAGIAIPDNLLLLSGFSAISFAGAKTITTAKVDAAKQAAKEDARKAGGTADVIALAAKQAVEQVKPDAKPDETKFLGNLVANDQGNTDLGDVQMLIVTLLAVGVYLALVFKSLGAIACIKSVILPEVDTTLMSVFGLGQGAYLAKKAGGRVGES